jgi:hypothetical protein
MVMLAAAATAGRYEAAAASWLDAPKPPAWNAPGQAIPAAPKVLGEVDARCRDHARPPQLAEDAQVRDRGWDLVDAYQGGWQVVVIGGTASYDGMCRPRQYQQFVFVGGVFAGTLSPQPMDSRTDGALTRVWLQSDTALTAEYARYANSDALCCPSRTSHVVFEITKNPPLVHPVSVSTSENPK